MHPIASILLPVDFSPRCHSVLPLIRALAAKLGAKMTLFYSVPLPEGLIALEPQGEQPSNQAHPFTLDTEATLRDSREQLLRFYDEPAGAVQTAAEFGDPAHRIVEYAAANGIDLIMMPTHGYGRFRGMLLGSITAKVLHDSLCPVWTATHTLDTESPSHADCRSVLCALDLKSGSADLLRHAVEFAAPFAAEVRIVHAVDEVLPGTGEMAGTSFQDFLLDAAKERIDEIQTKAGTHLDVCLGNGNVADWVGEVARHHAADLVVIGRGRLQGALGRLRTNAYSIIRQAPCPVLSF